MRASPQRTLREAGVLVRPHPTNVAQWRDADLSRHGDVASWRAVRPGDVAILFARMTNSLDYERQLQLRGIPYHVLSGTGFFRQQEVFDVLNALRVIDNPFDDVALFGMLRGGMFGLDDNALMHVAETLDPPYLPALTRIADDGDCEKNPRKAFRGLSEHRSETLAFAIGLLGALHRRKDTVGIDSLIARLLEETGYEATLGSQFHGRRMVCRNPYGPDH